VTTLAEIEQLSEMERHLVSRDLDGIAPGIDPEEEITPERVRMASQELSMDRRAVLETYLKLSPIFRLRLSSDLLEE
jgi:hypothetical protein